jgi:hypothetical protein
LWISLILFALFHFTIAFAVTVYFLDYSDKNLPTEENKTETKTPSVPYISKVELKKAKKDFVAFSVDKSL